MDISKSLVSICIIFFFCGPLQAQDWDNGYKEDQFKNVLSIFKKVYTPIINKKGGIFEIDADWLDGSVNAFAWRERNIYRIEVPGGLSRYDLFNEDAYISMLCHEMGHLLGGQPMSYEISFEGQSDYYATSVCLKLILPYISDVSPAATPEITKLCGEDRICQRSLIAALTMGQFDAKIAKVTAPKLSTPDPTAVNKSLRTHPNPQCRLDTRKAGALGLARPACWYKADGTNSL